MNFLMVFSLNLKHPLIFNYYKKNLTITLIIYIYNKIVLIIIKIIIIKL